MIDIDDDDDDECEWECAVCGVAVKEGERYCGPSCEKVDMEDDESTSNEKEENQRIFNNYVSAGGDPSLLIKGCPVCASKNNLIRRCRYELQSYLNDIEDGQPSECLGELRRLIFECDQILDDSCPTCGYSDADWKGEAACSDTWHYRRKRGAE